jgi:glutamate-ammonia-ligase adenylyltransferase
VLATSRYATELLLQAPEAVSLLADDVELEPRTRGALAAEVSSVLERHDDSASAVAAIRSIRRRELFRIAAAELLHVAGPEQSGHALSDVATVAVEGAVQVARAEADPDGRVEFAVIGMGRFGGLELGFGSDVDVMFVYRAHPGIDDEAALRAATAIAEELRRLLMAPSGDPPIDVDADLRPEGKQGPLVRSLESYAAYYERWSSTWEAQALLRASIVAGDLALGEDFLALIDPLRWTGSLTVDELTEVRRLKARMESERLPRGADPSLHTKLGRGGLSDVEWVVQVMQMEHAERVAGLRTTRTLAALEAGRAAGLVEDRDAAELAEAWRFATAIRNAVTLVRGRPGDMVPSDVRDLRAVAYVLGYPIGETGRMVDSYRRVTRRARQVFERLFYGLDEG